MTPSPITPLPVGPLSMDPLSVGPGRPMGRGRPPWALRLPTAVPGRMRSGGKVSQAAAGYDGARPLLPGSLGPPGQERGWSMLGLPALSRRARWAVPAGAVAVVAAVATASAVTIAQAAPKLPARTPAQLLAAVAGQSAPPPL